MAGPTLNPFRGDQYYGFKEDQGYDPNRYEYGGSRGYADREKGRLYTAVQQADQRAVPMVHDFQTGEARNTQLGSLGSLDAASHGGTADTRLLSNAARGQSKDMRYLGDAAAGNTQDMRYLSDAAAGNAPSRAEILGQQMRDQAIRGQVSAAGNVRGGPGAGAAAYRYASQNAAQQRAQMNQGIQAERANELAGARNAYSGAMSGARRDYATGLGTARDAYGNAMSGARRDAFSGASKVRDTDADLAKAEADVQLRGMKQNDDRAMHYEDLRQGIDKAQMTGNLAQQDLLQRSVDKAQDRNAEVNKENADTAGGIWKGIWNGVTSLIGGLSDEDAKEPVWGSLAGLGEPAAPSSGHKSGGALAGLGDPAGSTSGAMGISPAGIKNLMTSDEHAKQAAFEAGLDYGAKYGAAVAAKGDAGESEGRSTVLGKASSNSVAKQDQAIAKYLQRGDAKYDRAAKSALGDFGLAASVGQHPMFLAPALINTALGTSNAEMARSSAKERRDIVAGSQPNKPARSGQQVERLDMPPVKVISASLADSPKGMGAYPEQALYPEQAAGAARQYAQQFAAPSASVIQRPTEREYSDEKTKKKFGTVSDAAMADAARSMQPSPYKYKAEYNPASQAPGEVNVGPMANAMAKDPVASTAVVRDPGTGMLAIDKDKGLKVVMGSLAALQHQVDDLRSTEPRGDAKKARYRGQSAHA